MSCAVPPFDVTVAILLAGNVLVKPDKAVMLVSTCLLGTFKPAAPTAKVDCASKSTPNVITCGEFGSTTPSLRATVKVKDPLNAGSGK